ncbi:LysR family glycine cleavage system transcriptional activator [Bradyrhizobium sp. GM2.4]
MRRLLFLNGIKAFEAAARAGSFAAAGLELSVSAAAVSRMVHILEERLGVALFERKANKLLLTQAGRAYQSGLTPIFDALASLTAQVTAPSSVRVLTIGIGHTFAMRWLIPRLSEFRSEEPDIEVRFTTGGASVPFGEDWSCGIQLGTGDWPGLVAEPLFAGDLTPVCVPRLASSLKRPADLKAPSLIRVAHSPEDWPIWLKAANLARVNARGPEFQFYGQALQAAADGLGIAMGIRPYIDETSPPAGWWRHSSSRCPRACAGTCSIAASRPSSATLPRSAGGSCARRRNPPPVPSGGPAAPARGTDAAIGLWQKSRAACERLHIPESANVVP